MAEFRSALLNQGIGTHPVPGAAVGKPEIVGHDSSVGVASGDAARRQCARRTLRPTYWANTYWADTYRAGVQG